MRLWSLHPKHLDQKGLVALWREALLAKAVLEGKTKGYKNHSQLERFKSSIHPLHYIYNYLNEIWLESLKRGYNFSVTKVPFGDYTYLPKLTVTTEQLSFEASHLKSKVDKRDPRFYSNNLSGDRKFEPHPMFKIINGPIEKWEKF